MLPAATAFLLLAVQAAGPSPYLDTQKRFALTLPAGWSFSPLAGDEAGASFRRQEGTALALAGVKVFRFASPKDLPQFDARVRAAYDQELGYSVVPNTEGPTTLAGRPAMRRRFLIQVAPGRPLRRLVDQHTLVADQTGYAIECESIAENFSAFEGDCRQLVASFRPGEDLDKLPHHRHAVAPLAAHHLVGRWQGGSHQLRLTPGGAAVLDRLEGTWHIDHGTLVLAFDGREERIEVERRSDGVTLSGGTFGDAGVFFRPQVGAARPRAAETAPPVEGAPAPTAP